MEQLERPGHWVHKEALDSVQQQQQLASDKKSLQRLVVGREQEASAGLEERLPVDKELLR